MANESNIIRVQETNVFRSHYYFCKTNLNNTGTLVTINDKQRYMYREYRGFGRYHFYNEDIKSFLQVELFMFLNILINNLDDILSFYKEPNYISFKLKKRENNDKQNNVIGCSNTKYIDENDVTNKEKLNCITPTEKMFLISSDLTYYDVVAVRCSEEKYTENDLIKPSFEVYIPNAKNKSLKEKNETIQNTFNNILSKLSLIKFINHLDVKLGNGFSTLTYPIIINMFENLYTKTYTYVKVNVEYTMSERLQGLLMLLFPTVHDFLMHQSICDYFEDNLDERIDDDITEINIAKKNIKLAWLEKKSKVIKRNKKDDYISKVKNCYNVHEK